MKKLIIPVLVGVSTLIILTGCIDLSRGNDTTTIQKMPTVGQQLMDLKKAKDTGVISDAEYEAEKARLLGKK